MISKTIKAIAFSSFLLTSILTQAQTEDHSGAWHTLLLKHKINSKFTIKNELHVRRTQFYSQWQQLLLRPGLDYALTKNTTLSAGYSYIKNYSENGHALEHNVWEEISLSNSVQSIDIKHRFRFEQRFSQTFTSCEYKHSNRFRYRITLKKPIAKINENQILKAVAFNEIWLNTRNGIQPQSINQNWVYLGLSLPIKNKTLSAGYLQTFFPVENNSNITHHILQLSITVNI